MEAVASEEKEEMNESRPRTQPEVIAQVKRQKDAAFAALLKAEGEINAVLQWADLPTTKKIRAAFGDFKNGVIKIFKQNKWTEGEGRGLAFVLQFADLLEDEIKKAQNKLARIRQQQEKEKQKQKL